MVIGAMLLYTILITSAGVLHLDNLIAVYNESYVFSYEVESYKSMAHVFTYFLMLFMPVHLLYYFNIKLLKVRDLTKLATVLIFIQVLSAFLYTANPILCFVIKALSGILLIITFTYLHWLVYKNIQQVLPE